MNESLKTREFLQKENKIVRKAEKKKVAFFFFLKITYLWIPQEIKNESGKYNSSLNTSLA